MPRNPLVRRTAPLLLIASIALFALLVHAGPAAATAGDPDTDFGRKGQAVAPLPGFARPEALARRPDGRLVVIGRYRRSANSRDDFGLAIARFGKDGLLDRGFGTDGVVLEPGPEGYLASDLVLSPEGKLITVGETRGAFTVVRYDADGTLDASFGSGGVVTTLLPSSPSAADFAALQPDGRILVAGRTGKEMFVLARYTPDGSLDPSFGTAGIVLEPTGADEGVSTAGLVLQPDGRPVIAGFFDEFGTSAHPLLFRYLPNGSRDSSFGSGGSVDAPVGVSAWSLGLQRDGRLVLGGRGRSRLALLRFRADGALDRSFGSAGAAFGPPDTQQPRVARLLAVEPGGGIIVAGPQEYALRPLTVARFTRRGAVDPTFGGSDGIITTRHAGEFPGDLLIGPDGKLLLAGAGQGEDRGFAVARYHSAPVGRLLGVAPSRSLRAAARQGFRIRLGCTSGCRVALTARQALPSGRGQRLERPIAATTVRLRRAGERAVTLRPSAEARRRLSRLSRAELVLTLRFSAVQRTAEVLTRRLTLRR